MAINKKDSRYQEHLHAERIKRSIKRDLDAEERPVVIIPPIATMGDLLAKPRDPIKWIVQDWQPQDSRVILAAQFKAGKTTLISNLIRSLVDHDKWLGQYDISPLNGPVTLLDFEMGERMLVQWYRDQEIKNAHNIKVFPMRGLANGFNIIDEHVREEWKRRLQGTSYLIIDCLRPILDAIGLNEDHEAGIFLVAVDHLLKDLNIQNCAVVQHMGHSKERSRGDSRLRDWPDVEWRLIRSKGNEEEIDPAAPRFITAYGRDVDRPEQELGYDSVKRRLFIAGGSRREVKIGGALPVILEFLKKTNKAMSRTQIVRELSESGFTKETLHAALKHGAKQGFILTHIGARGAEMCQLDPQMELEPEESML